MHGLLPALPLLLLHELLKAITNWFIVEVVELGCGLCHVLVVSEFLGHWVGLEVDICETSHSSEVLDLIK